MPKKGVWRPFVSIMPHFGSHNTVFWGESSFEQRVVLQGAEPGDGWPTSQGELAKFRRRNAGFHCPAPLRWGLAHSYWRRGQQSGPKISIRLPGSRVPLLRKISIRHRLMTGSRPVRRPVCLPRGGRRVPSFDPCLQNSRSDFNRPRNCSPRDCRFKAGGSLSSKKSRSHRASLLLPFPFPGLVRSRRTWN